MGLCAYILWPNAPVDELPHTSVEEMVVESSNNEWVTGVGVWQRLTARLATARDGSLFGVGVRSVFPCSAPAASRALPAIVRARPLALVLLHGPASQKWAPVPTTRRCIWVRCAACLYLGYACFLPLCRRVRCPHSNPHSMAYAFLGHFPTLRGT